MLRITHSAHTVFICFVFIWEQTATSAPHNINWLVFKTEMKSVYSAVRIGSSNKAVCVSSLKGWRLICLTLKNYTFCPHCIYVFCIYLRTNSDLCHLQHKLISFYNRDEKYLLRGTNWIFKFSCLRFVCKGLKSRRSLNLLMVHICLITKFLISVAPLGMYEYKNSL